MADVKPRYRKRDHPSYFIWTGVKGRVGKLKNYKDVDLAPEWEDCAIFADWCDKQIGFNQIDENGYYFELDKDIFSPPDAKIYSPETCCFVPKAINLQFLGTNKKGKGKLFDGLTFNHYNETFQVTVNTEFGSRILGNFYNELEAFECLHEFRSKTLRELAVRYKDKLDDRVFDHLFNYNVVYPKCKNAGSQPIPISIHHAEIVDYEISSYLNNRETPFFFEDGKSWTNIYQPWRRTEDVFL